tara:strand:- start:2104 stop:3063 length:960 start_codon:yes stop_codon:yes gene_type:complete
MKKKKKKKRRRGKFIHFCEYLLVCSLILFSRVVPFKVMIVLSYFLGHLLYLIVPSRRHIAIDNIRNAFNGQKNEKEIKQIAVQSFYSFFLMLSEILKYRFKSKGTAGFQSSIQITEDIKELFQKAKKIHDESKGCIFVTPHIGNWELLPYASSIVGIPLAIVVRPLDNTYLENMIFKDRAVSGQVIIPKKNALFTLKNTLRKGKSIGILPDQGTMKGIAVNFFGRKANTTPIPAVLAVTYQRPIVVVACCRKADGAHFEGFVCDPIWPLKDYKSEKQEIYRITEEIHKKIEYIVRKYPEQYLWIHRRWKEYENIKELFS